MIRVRFARFGAKKHPYYHIVVTDIERPRDGRYIEQLGTYDPAKPMTDARIRQDRLDYWLSMGAKPTDSVAKVLREHKKTMAAVQAA